MSEEATPAEPEARPTPSGRARTFERRHRLGIIAMIVTGIGIVVPPLVGLFGTVFGMAEAFDAVGRGGGGDPEELSRGVSTALLTTAGGIVVSLVCVALFLVSFVLWLINLSARKNEASH